jgi:hypothetical protein
MLAALVSIGLAPAAEAKNVHAGGAHGPGKSTPADSAKPEQPGQPGQPDPPRAPGRPDHPGRPGPSDASGGGGAYDPVLFCVSAKLREAGRYCDRVLKAWSIFERTGHQGVRDAAVAQAARKLAAGWHLAEARASAAGIECGGAFLAASTAGAFIDSATGALVATVNDGLDLGDPAHARCGAKILKSAADKCRMLFDAESAYQKHRTTAGAAARRAAAVARIARGFAAGFDRGTAGGCPTEAGEADVEGQVDAIVARIVRDTLASPEAGDGAYVTIDGEPTTYQGRTFTPVCMDGSPYRFFARRGTVNKLVVYYQGGGACWEQLTCGIPTCDDGVTDSDNPDNFSTGFADLSNPANPFRDWNAVFVSYCSCDVHFGDAAQDYANVNPASPKHVEHRGYHNAKVVEKWAREHFLAPEAVFVTGSSAGAYGAWFNGPLLHAVWPSAHFSVLADAGNGVVTQEFLETYFPNWNFEANLPPDIPELKQVLDDGEGIVGYTKVITRIFPNTSWAHYTAAFDGGTGGQTGFYNLMLNGNDPLAALTWWEGSCAFRNQMRAQAIETAAAVDQQDGNYRYYIGSGSRHTMWGSNKVYVDVTGGVPTIVDWVSAMLASRPGAPDPGWTNVEASPYNIVLPGDPRPSPLVPPFVQVGADVLIDCPAP